MVEVRVLIELLSCGFGGWIFDWACTWNHAQQ